VEFGDKSGDEFQHESKRTTLADALHQSGAEDEAYELFIQAEQMQKARTPEDRFLFSLRGYQFCDLLLSRGEYEEVLERAEWTLQFMGEEYWLLGKALDNLSLGRASMLLAIQQKNDSSLATMYLNQAVDRLRDAGVQELIPLGLLARATLSRLQTNFPQAHIDLDETRDIAERGEMLLHLTDYHLESCRLALAEGDKGNKAAEHLDTARELIEKTGYHRRDSELAELEEQLSVGKA
jgi:hypothetical protein